MKKPLQVFNFSITNRGNKTVDINIDGEIVDASTQSVLQAWFGDTTSTSYKSFRNSLDKEDADTYNVIINSPGGVVTDAMAIHDLLVDLQSKGKIVNTIGRGLIASSATLILMAGNKPEMSANSMFMIHTVSGGTWGTVDQIENYAVAMRKFNNQIVDLYSNRTGLSKDELNNMMVKETWLTAQEALDQKFIAVKGGESKFTNLISSDNWPFENIGILNNYNNLVNIEKPENFDNMKKFFADLKADILAAIKGVPANADHSQLMNSIGEAISKPFENMGDSLDTAVTEAVKAAVGTAVTEAIKPLNKEIEDLTAEVVAIKGKQTGGGKEEGVVPVGSFKKA